MSDTFFWIGKIIFFLINAIGIWLAFWALMNSRAKITNRLFFIITFILIIWADIAVLANIIDNVNYALFLIKLDFGIISLFFISIFYFGLYFPDDLIYGGIKKKSAIFNFLSLIVFALSLINIYLVIVTPYVIKSVVYKEWGLNIILGDYAGLFYFNSLLLTALIIYFFIKKYFTLKKIDKLKAYYVLFGIIIFAAFNIIFNIILPKFNRFEFALFGHYSIIFFLGFTAYAIAKRKLFEIKAILTTIIVGFIAILLLFDIFILTSNSIFQLFKILTLVIFLYFGYILIKSVLKEIDERKKMEKLTRKLKIVNTGLENANKKLKKIDQAKSEFLSIASHQLRTPLTVIKGYISMIREGFYGQMPEKTKIPLENVYISTEKLVHLINDFLNFSKLEAGKIELKIEESSIEEIIISLVDELKIEAERKNLKLSWEKPKDPLPKLMIDKDKIRQVFINLIDNAIKYTKKGSITVSAKHIRLNNRNKDKIVISVKDTGEGVTKEDQSKIFESFSRGRAGTKFYASGSGLGLYICRQFVNMHHGRIWAESAGKYKGSTFYVELSV